MSGRLCAHTCKGHIHKRELPASLIALCPPALPPCSRCPGWCTRHAHTLHAAVAGILSALAPALLLDTATGLLIENAWSVAVERSIKAGKLLAAVLMGGGHGDRPVTLVAHSMGARLVFHCLLELCRCGCRGALVTCPPCPALWLCPGLFRMPR